MTVAEVAYAVLRKHFAAFLRNDPGTRLGEDPEALHDMRVATRRMRAAMSLFAPYLPPRINGYRTQFGWVAGVLGAVRDLDVQLERIAEWQKGVSESQAQGLAAVGALLERRRDAARRRMLFALNSRRFETLCERFASALRHGAPHNFAAGREPILAAAPGLVEKRYRRVRRRGDAISPPSPPAQYHALRIDAKKLRYALEFVAPVYGKPALDFIARVTALQDVLGLHQDAEVAVTMLEDMASQSGRRLGPNALLAMGAVAERYRQHAVELRAQFPKVYRPLAGEEWRRLQRTMESRG
jgi:CHAD domain-containing protein